MEPVIRSLTIKGFRSIPSERVELDNPIFLAGRNGSGKSNFVDVFAFLAESMNSPLRAVFDRRGGISEVRYRSGGGPPNLGLGVDFGELEGGVSRCHYAFDIGALANYGFGVFREQCVVTHQDGSTYWFDRDREGFRTNNNLGGLHPQFDPSSLAMPLVGADSRFNPVVRALSGMRVYSIEPAKIKELQDPDDGASLRSDGSNLASVLEAIERRSSDDYERIREILACVVPKLKAIDTVSHGKKLSLSFVQEWGEGKRLDLEAFSMSDGTLRALGILAAAYQQPKPSLIVIEEPEATIHPGALGAILDVIKHASRQMQVIVTTHSPELLDAKWIRENNLRIAGWQDGATHITPIEDSSRRVLEAHLVEAGELLRSNALEAPFVSKDGRPQAVLFENPA